MFSNECSARRRHALKRQEPKRQEKEKKRQENEREEQEHAARLAALRSAIDEGDASGVAAGNVFGRIRKTLKLSASR